MFTLLELEQITELIQRHKVSSDIQLTYETEQLAFRLHPTFGPPKKC